VLLRDPDAPLDRLTRIVLDVTKSDLAGTGAAGD
jgi:hypothetical protein